MPVIQLKTNCCLDKTQSDAVLKRLVECISTSINKPLPNIMAMYSHKEIIMNDSDEDAAYVEIMYVGDFSSETKNNLCNSVLEILIDFLDIDPERVYINLNIKAREDAWKYVKKS